MEDVGGSEEGEAAVVVIVVVPPEEVLALAAGVQRPLEAARVVGLVIERLELALAEGVVVGDAGAAEEVEDGVEAEEDARAGRGELVDVPGPDGDVVNRPRRYRTGSTSTRFGDRRMKGRGIAREKRFRLPS